MTESKLHKKRERKTKKDGSKTKKLKRDYLTLTEKWNVRMLETVASVPWAFKSQAKHTVISKIYDRVFEKKESNGFGQLTVSYGSSENIECGRLYGCGFQGVPGYVRRLCVPPSYRDIDIVNCYPVLLEQIAKKRCIETPRLSELVKNRDEILAADMEEQGISRKEAKRKYLKVLFDEKTDKHPHDSFLAKYQNEVETITNRLWVCEDLKEFKVAAENNNKEYNKEGSFLSYVIQSAERKVVEVAMDFFRKKQFNIATYVFDGFMIDDPHKQELPLIECSNHVAEVTGYTVEFAEKDLTPTDEDWLKLRHPFNDYRQENKWKRDIVFRKLKVLAHELNEKPSAENVDEFKDSCVNLLNYVMAVNLEEKGLVVIHRTFEDKKGWVYEQMDSKSDLLAKYGHYQYFIDVPEGNSVKICAIKSWLDSTRRLQYERRVMNPAPYDKTDICAKYTELNSWTGFIYRQTQQFDANTLKQLEDGELKAVTNYVQDIVCNGNEVLYRWLLNWISWTIKFPWIKLPTVPILRSDDEGTGKTTLSDIMKRLMGTKYWVKPSTVDELQRTFNEHLFANTLLMVLDEAHRGHSKAAAGAFRNTITAEEKMLERKFRDGRMQPVYYNIIMMSNDKKIVHIPGSNRRFVVIEVNPRFGGPHTSESKAYFDSVYATNWQLLFNYLCSLPNDDWNYRELPPTTATRDQVVSSFDVLDTFFHDMLQDPERYICGTYDADNGGLVSKRGLYDGCFRDVFYGEMSKLSVHHQDIRSEAFWKRFRQTFPSTGKETRIRNINGEEGRERYFEFPKLATLRSDFCKKHKYDFFNN